MKKIIFFIILFTAFGLAKAHYSGKITPRLKPIIVVTPINNLSNYETTFKFIPIPKYFYYYKTKPDLSVQNKLAVMRSEDVPSAHTSQAHVLLRHRVLKMKQV